MKYTQPPKQDITQLQEISDKFICPVCKHKATISTSNVACSNINCKIVFPVINTVPILINEQDSIFNIKDFIDHANAKDLAQSTDNSFLKNVKQFFPSLSNNLSSKDNFKLLEKLLIQKEKPKILIVGGATITTDTERIFKANHIIVESDIYIGPRTQIIIDSHSIPFADETFDLVIYQAVLEHVADPYKCVQEAHRVLNKEGLIFAATPFMQQVHMRAFDFTRFTHLGHRRLFRAFTEIESGVFAGTGVALGWSIRAFAVSLCTNKFVRSALQIAVSLVFFWVKYIDFLIIKTKGTYDGASGFYFIGRKSDKILSDKDLIKLFRGI